MTAITPDSGDILNYFDTGGNPLTRFQMAQAAACATAMMGPMESEDKARQAQAKLSTYIRELYDDVLCDVFRTDPERMREATRHAMAVLEFQQHQMPYASLEETSIEFRDRGTDDPEFLSTRLIDVGSDAEVESFSRNPTHWDVIRSLGYTWLTPKEMPTHSMLCELIRAEGRNSDFEQFIADMLEPFCAHGPYGAIVDGVQNIKFGAPVDHFELGGIADSARQLRDIICFAFSNQIRNYILSLPRRVPKRVVIDEVGAFVRFPSGPEILRQMFTQYRKFNCWVLIGLQQVEQLAHGGVLAEIVGNTKMFFLMNNSQRDLDQLDPFIQLPPATKEMIRGFGDPKRDGFSSFCYVHLGESGRPMITAGQLHANKELLVCTTGDDLLRKRILRSPDVTQEIVKCAEE